MHIARLAVLRKEAYFFIKKCDHIHVQQKGQIGKNVFEILVGTYEKLEVLHGDFSYYILHVLSRITAG